ncbi:MAG TPA: serpin family protein [Candidatus Latescibacteria bacterium]|nr:serpin family protein [Candidatus Latescibacterota bacterium]HQK22985.1 serpin family protein [Candidatus Latescibacterota bacterium]
MPSRNSVLSGVFVLGVLLLAGCDEITRSGDPGGATGAADPRLAKEAVPPALVDANMRFAFGIYQRLVETPPAENLFISPASISLALAMAYNGAAGNTKEAMARTLGLGEMTLEEANQANLVLLSNLVYADETAKLAIANSVWANQGYGFYESFLDRNRRYFGAEVATLDFARPSALATINGWVERNTFGKIPSILDEIPDFAIMYLINAIYFKGEWTNKFDVAETRMRPFTLSSGSAKNVPMMTRHGRYAYLQNDLFQGVALPYGNKRFSMYVLLPKEDVGLAALNRALTVSNWTTWVAAFDTMEGTISLPRFEARYEETLNSVLSAMGMGVAFDPYGADFSAMLSVSPSRNVFINEVKHKTYLKVDEEGSEAAAATSVGFGVTSVPVTFNMVVNRPFFLVIRENKSGTILFMGTIVDPSS